jgi:inner membrane protein
MDNVTHALAGLLLADVTTHVLARRTGTPVARPVRRTAAVLGVVAAELPDLDILYSGPVLGMGKLGYLLHHRGHTHTVLAAVVAALLLWGLTLWWSRAVREGPVRRAMLALALAGTLSHIALDWTNSYGVHPFWPVDNRWFYGDQVFIVEPWLWVLAIPPLVFGARSRVGRGLLLGALGLILVASFTLGVVPRAVAITLLLAALGWSLLAWRATAGARVALGGGAWLAFETLSGVASASARGTVARAVPVGLADVVLTPAAANPLCLDALVVEATDSLYRVHRATVAAWPALQSAAACGRAGTRGVLASGDVGILRAGRVAVAHAPDASITWHVAWAARRAELVALAERCDVRAALGFMRVPVWQVAADGTIRLSDLRYGTGGDGFADVEFGAVEGECPAPVPPWVPPRAREAAVPD